MNQIQGCTIELLEPEICERVLAWVTEGKSSPPWAGDGFTWLLAHCRDGVTWGRHDGSCWRLSATPFPGLCPNISQGNLLEMRLFGPKGEILIWRSEDGLLGRRLLDEPNDEHRENDSPTRPDDEVRILLGDRRLDGPKDGFTLVATATGTQQAVPLECTDTDFKEGRWPLRLKVRHYFIQAPETGAVRVAVTRLVNVFKENSNGKHEG